jgi:hypothetical protein
MQYDFNQEREKMAKNNDQTAYWLDRICPGPNALSFDKVPELVKTEEFCLAAVQQNGSDLKYVPNALRTEAICLAAVQKNGAAFEFVQENLRVKVEAALK